MRADLALAPKELVHRHVASGELQSELKSTKVERAPSVHFWSFRLNVPHMAARRELQERVDKKGPARRMVLQELQTDRILGWAQRIGAVLGEGLSVDGPGGGRHRRQLQPRRRAERRVRKRGGPTERKRHLRRFAPDAVHWGKHLAFGKEEVGFGLDG